MSALESAARALQKEAPPARQRILSLDALRGFDMFWIAGGDTVFWALREMSGTSAVLGLVTTQLEHVKWEGFRFFDLIFPLFVFMIGISVVLSLSRIREREGVRAAHWRVLRRFALLFILAVVYEGAAGESALDERLMGVLPRLTVCYLFTGLLFLRLRVRGLIATCAVLLLGYWALLTSVPAPGEQFVSFEPGRNLTNWVDMHVLPSGRFDNEGILSTAPAIASCLLGLFAGLLLTSGAVSEKRKVFYLVGGGAVMTALGYLWGLQFPVIKNLWTSSYVLVAGGYSSMLLGLFYFVIDTKRLRWWAQPFVWIGANSITIYFLPTIVPLPDLAYRILGDDIVWQFGRYGPVVISAMAVGFIFLFAWVLYRRQILIRV